MDKIEKTGENLENVQQYVDFVKENLQPLADHLKVGIDWLWNILVMQARVEAIVMLIVVATMSITTITLMTIFFKHLKKARYVSSYGRTYVYKNKKTGKEVNSLLDDWENREDYTQVELASSNKEFYVSLVTGIGAALMLLTSVITASSTVATIVTGLVNPEFRAIEKIVEFAKPAAEEAKTKVEVETK